MVVLTVFLFCSFRRHTACSYNGMFNVFFEKKLDDDPEGGSSEEEGGMNTGR